MNWQPELLCPLSAVIQRKLIIQPLRLFWSALLLWDIAVIMGLIRPIDFLSISVAILWNAACVTSRLVLVETFHSVFRSFHSCAH